MSSAPNSNPFAVYRTRAALKSGPAMCFPCLLIAVWLGSALALSAQAQSGGKPLLDHAIEQTGDPPTIVVKTAPGQAHYSKVQTPTIPVLVRFRGDCDKGEPFGNNHLELAGSKLKVDPTHGDGWRTYQFDLAPAPLQLWTGAKPLAENKPLPRASAVEMCNQALAKQGAKRERMLAEGSTLRPRSALTARFVLQCQHLDKRTSAYLANNNSYPWVQQASVADGGIDVLVKCAPMVAADAPQPQKKTTTTGAPPRPGKPMPPAIESVKLRAEVSTKQACPDSVRLVGSITARAPSHGAYIFLGNFYLSPKGSYDFDGKGHRSVVAVRKLNWDSDPKGPAAVPGAVKTQDGWVQLNVIPQGSDKIYSSGRVPFRAVCRPTPIPATTR